MALYLLCAGSLRADFFAGMLLNELYAPDDNIVFSPCSITVVLGMAGAGARGDTATQMARVLQSGGAHEGFAQYCAVIQKTVSAAVSPNITLRVASAIFPQKEYALLPDYLECIKNQFRSGVVPVDYLNDRENSRRLINRWVFERTAGRIPELVKPETLSNEARLTLVNAVYFKAPWAYRFAHRDTRISPFTLPNGTVKTVPFMNQERFFRYHETEAAQLVDIPYIDDKLVMTLILPVPGHTIVQAVDAFAKVATSPFAYTNVSLSFPKFTFTANYSLNKTLQQLGMTDAFVEGLADFSGMDGTRTLYISDVVHQAFIEVNEDGTLSVAATKGMTAFGPPPTPKIFLADRPFAFAIRVRDTDTLIFLGVLNNP